jgi:tRNA nucleotidyltransferase (CCA-adding enzyme)
MHAPHAYRDLGRLAAAHHPAVRDAAQLAPDALLELLQRLDAFRRPGRLADLARAVQADDLDGPQIASALHDRRVAALAALS